MPNSSTFAVHSPYSDPGRHADLLRALLRDERRILTVSRVQEGTSGIRDVALSLPTVIGSTGAVHVMEPEMSKQEHEALERSAEALRRAAAQSKTASGSLE